VISKQPESHACVKSCSRRLLLRIVSLVLHFDVKLINVKFQRRAQGASQFLVLTGILAGRIFFVFSE